MKTIQFLRAAIILIGIFLSACAPAASSVTPANVGGGKSLSDVTFSGVIESMTGDQWVVNGQTIQVSSSVLRDGPFTVGDTVKVEASIADDGSVTAQRIETPSAADVSTSATSAPDNSLPVPDVSATQAPAFDTTGNEAFGTVDAITDTTVTVDGQTYTFASGFELKGDILAGSSVKLHLTLNSDGTFSVREIELADPTQFNDDNGTDDPANHDVNDDHGGETNSNDDGVNHDANDDHGGGDDNSGGNSGHGG